MQNNVVLRGGGKGGVAGSKKIYIWKRKERKEKRKRLKIQQKLQKKIFVDLQKACEKPVDACMLFHDHSTYIRW